MYNTANFSRQIIVFSTHVSSPVITHFQLAYVICCKWTQHKSICHHIYARKTSIYDFLVHDAWQNNTVHWYGGHRVINQFDVHCTDVFTGISHKIQHHWLNPLTISMKWPTFTKVVKQYPSFMEAELAKASAAWGQLWKAPGHHCVHCYNRFEPEECSLLGYYAA
jgi:hypothetical protein